MELLKIRVCTAATLLFLATACSSEELTLSVNFRRPLSISNERFLSFTVDPEAFLHPDGGLSKNFEKSIHIAQAFAPAYIRIGGPTSNSFVINETLDRQANHNESNIFSESNWNRIHQWIERTGLDLIACISPENMKASSDNARMKTILALNDRMGYNTSWQLGYECQTRCNISASDLGARVANLRRMLDENTRYSSSIITGPDVISCETKQQQAYLQNYLSYAAPALSAITWHPDLDAMHVEGSSILMQHDNLALDKENLYRSIGDFIGDRPLWIAESRKESEKDKFLGALAWANRLGTAAKLKVDVMMRQLSDVSSTNPDFWVSVLHKQLIGRKVFDVKIQGEYKDEVQFYCHCTKVSDWYEGGSVTIFGSNLSPEYISVLLKNHKITTLHKYILSPGLDVDNKLLSKNVLLNDENLNLMNDTYVPSIKPEILVDRRGLNLDLSSNAIGFWVLPELKIRSCMEEHANERAARTRAGKSRINTGLLEDDDVDITQTGSLEIRKTLVKRRTKQRNFQDDDKIRRRLTRRDVRRELNRLKKFLKKKLEYYQDKNTQMSDQVSEASQDKVDAEESIESRLRVHKERLLALKNSLQGDGDTTRAESINRDVLTRSLELISKIERNFENMRTRFGDTKRMTPRVKDRLRSLYELLNRTSPQEQEVNDSSESGKEVQENLRRSRRDLDGSADQLTARKDAAKARSRMEQLRERRNDRKLKRKDDIRREVQPSPLEHRATDSGENNFYGFFRRAPAKDFPQGDVFLSTGDSAQNNDYDYVRDEDYSAGSKEEASVDGRVTQGTGDQVLPQDTWVEEGNDYHSYAPNEFFENIKLNNYPVKKTANGNAELSEIEQAEQEESGQPENEGSQDHSEEELLKEGDARSSTQYGNQNPNYSESFGQGPISNLRSSIRARQAQNPKHVYFTQHSSLLKNARSRLGNQPRSILGRRIDALSSRNQHSDNLEFPVGAYDNTQHKRPKRKKDDLTTLLDEEMIKEDERNSKDCRCRVIRKSERSPMLLCRKRRNTEQDETDGNPKDSLVQETPVELIVPVPVEVETLDPKMKDVEVLEPEVLTTKTLEPSLESGPVIVQEQLVSDTELESETPTASLQEAVETIEESSTPIADDTTNVPNYPVELSTADNLENPRNARQLSEDAVVTESPPTEALQDKNTDLLTEEANLHNETQFFREAPPEGPETTSNPIETVSGSIAYVPEHDASTRSPDLQEAAKPFVPQDIEGPGPEIRSSTAESTTRDKEGEAELAAGPSKNVDKDRSTTGTLKREVPLDETTPLGLPSGSSDRSNDTTVGSVNDVNKKATHPKHSSRARQRENERAEEIAKAREARLMARAKAILALRKENDSRKSKRIMQIPGRSSSQENAQAQERQKKRTEQIERLRSKLREKREKMLEQYEREILDIVDKIDDEEKKNVKRREAVERLGGSDDFKSMIDREKLAYVLMYNPDKYSLIKRDTFHNRPDSIEFITNDDIVGSRAEYERNRAAPSGRYFDDSRLTDYSSSYSKSERRRPSNFRKEDDRIKSEKYSSSDRKDSGMYYAIIESLSDPYYHRHTSHDRRKEYAEERLPLNCRHGKCIDFPRKYYTESTIGSDDDDDSADDDRDVEGNRRSSGRKLYIIDPSTYKGGEPTLQLHESPLRPSKASSGKGDHPRKRSYTPRSHNSSKKRQEDSESNKTTYLLGAPTSRDRPVKHNNGRLVGLLLNPARRTNKRPDNSTPSISNRKALKEKQTSNRNAKNNANVAGQASEGENSRKNPSEKEPLTETLVTSDAGEAKTQGDTGIRSTQDAQVNNDSKRTNTQSTIDETSVRRRRSTDNETKHRNFKRVPTSTLRGKAIEKRRNQPNYLCRKEDSDEASQEDPAVLYKLVKVDDHYKAVPTKDSGIRPRLLGRKRVQSEVEAEKETDKSVDDSDTIVGKSFDDYVRLMNLDENASYQSGEESGSSELLHIFLPSLAQNDYSPIQFLRGFGRYSDESYTSDEAHYAEVLESQEDEPIELKKRSSDSSSKMKLHIEDSSGELDRRTSETISGKSTETELDYVGVPDYESNADELSREYSDLEDAIVSDKYGILMVLPRKKKSHSRHRRDVDSREQSEIGENSDEITLPALDEHELNSEHVTNRIDEPNESSPRKKNATSYLEKKNLRKQYANKKVIWKNEAAENKDASFISKTVPKLEDVVVSGLKTVQNLTDSMEQLIDDIDQKFNETAIADDDQRNHKNGIPSVAHTAFHSMIINVKKFFTFLGGVTRILHG